MVRWVALMAHHVEGIEVVQFYSSYFCWLECQIFVIEDFPYNVIDFCGDREIALPAGEQWDDSGKNHFQQFLSSIFFFVF